MVRPAFLFATALPPFLRQLLLTRQRFRAELGFVAVVKVGPERHQAPDSNWRLVPASNAGVSCVSRSADARRSR